MCVNDSPRAVVCTLCTLPEPSRGTINLHKSLFQCTLVGFSARINRLTLNSMLWLVFELVLREVCVDECLKCRSQRMTNGFIAYIQTLIDVYKNDIKHAFRSSANYRHSLSSNNYIRHH